jgi:putative sugar O-methyltransferase
MRDVLSRAKLNLERAIKGSAGDPDLPHPGNRWETYAEAVRKQFETLLTPLQAVHFAQAPDRHGGFESRHTREKLEDAVDGHEAVLDRLFPHFKESFSSFAESPLSDPRSLAMGRGRLVSKPFYAHAHYIMRCLNYVKPASILEFGGGYGAAARLWMTNAIHQPSLYCDVDLPESLFFAENYLALHFGSESVVYIHGQEDLPLLSRPEVKFALCPTHAAKWLRGHKFNLVWNSNSMPEMSEAYIEYYMKWLDANRPDYFYSCNLVAYDMTKLDESVNFIAPILSEQWNAVLLETHGYPPYFTAEMMLRIGRPSLEPEALVRELLQQKLTARSYLVMLDATRSIKDGGLIWEIIKKVAIEFDYLPREIVHLCKLVDQLGNGSALGFQAFSERVIRIVNANRMGRVSPHLAAADAPRPEIAVDVPTGTIEISSEGGCASIDGEVYVISSDYFGSLEQLSNQGKNAMIAYGWAADTVKREPVTALYGFAGETLIAVGAPEYEREDIVGGFGDWGRKSGFRLKMPATPYPVTVIGVTSSGRAGRLQVNPDSSG